MKLSVIVPCYNVAPWIDRCLFSIINQSLTDLEIICIDDKSTDNTLEMLKLCAKNDLRIRVLENDENMGVGYSRNRGIDAAKGEFVGFVDPDDWIDSDFYEKLIKTAEKKLTPVVCGDVIEHPIAGKPIKQKRNMKKTWHSFNYHWSAVYLRDFLNRFNLHYPSIPVNEDRVFEASVKTNVPKPILYVPGTAYHYCKRLGSSSSIAVARNAKENYLDVFADTVNRILDMYNILASKSLNAISREGYVAGVHKYFQQFCECTVSVNPDKYLPIALAMFSRMLYIDSLLNKNEDMYTALVDSDKERFMRAVKNQHWHVRDYKLFNKIKIGHVRYNQVERHIYWFGIKVWTCVNS